MLRPIVLATAVALTAPMVAQADFSANVAATSNYIFRGVTQTNDAAAVSGGVDYSNASGFYAGTWISNVDFGAPANQYEQDWYAGYGFKAGGIDLDAGVIKYTYPVRNISGDLTEVYLNASMNNFKAGFAYTVSKDAAGPDNDLYIYAGADFEVKKDVTIGVLIGDYDFDAGSASDYTHFQISLSKGDFTLALDKNNTDTTVWGAGSDDPRFSVAWSKDFDL